MSKIDGPAPRTAQDMPDITLDQAAQRVAADTALRPDAANLVQATETSGDAVKTEGQIDPSTGLKDTATIKSTDEIMRSEVQKLMTGKIAEIGKPPAPPVVIEPKDLENAQNFSQNVDTIMRDVVIKPDGSPRTIQELSADVLLAAFLKMNVLDPLESTATKQDLAEAITNLAQHGIQAARKELENQAELAKEAEKNAKMMGFLMNIIKVVLIVVAVILIVVALVAAIFTGGLSLVIVAMILVALVALIGAMAAAGEAAAADGEAAQSKLDQNRLAKALGNLDSAEMYEIFEYMAQKELDAQKEETKQDSEGKPIGKALAALKGKMGPALTQLMAIGQAEGPEAMMAAAPAILEEAMMPVLKDINFKDPEKFVKLLVETALGQIGPMLADGSLEGDIIDGHGDALDTLGVHPEGTEAVAALLAAQAEQMNPATVAAIPALLASMIGMGALSLEDSGKLDIRKLMNQLVLNNAQLGLSDPVEESLKVQGTVRSQSMGN